MLIDIAYVSYNNLEENHPELVPTVLPDHIDQAAWEKILHAMPQAYLEVMICSYLGLSAKEAQQILQYKALPTFYTVNRRMRNFCREQITEVLDYN